jgi:hypothetical protein
MNDDLDKISELFEKQRIADNDDAEKFWQNLSYEDKCNAFHAVVSRIAKAELIDKGSYRYALYEVFGFQPDMYARGMNCGFLALHNSISADYDYDDGTIT